MHNDTGAVNRHPCHMRTKQDRNLCTWGVKVGSLWRMERWVASTSLPIDFRIREGWPKLWTDGNLRVSTCHLKVHPSSTEFQACNTLLRYSTFLQASGHCSFLAYWSRRVTASTINPALPRLCALRRVSTSRPRLAPTLLQSHIRASTASHIPSYSTYNLLAPAHAAKTKAIHHRFLREEISHGRRTTLVARCVR
jgi:hypothetical protein